MQWIKSGIENPSNSEVIGRCGEGEKPEWPRRTNKSRTLKLFIRINTSYTITPATNKDGLYGRVVEYIRLAMPFCPLYYQEIGHPLSLVPTFKTVYEIDRWPLYCKCLS